MYYCNMGMCVCVCVCAYVCVCVCVECRDESRDSRDVFGFVWYREIGNYGIVDRCCS